MECRGPSDLRRMARILRESVRIDKRRGVFTPLIGREEFNRLLDEFKECTVRLVLTEAQLSEAEEWVSRLLEELRETARGIGAQGWLLSKELKSFTENPLTHLKKKLFNYSYEYIRGRTSLKRYLSKASSAITTSYRTNLRTIYQDWVFLAIVKQLAGRGGRIVYPEHGYILLERSGRQRTGTIPPNLVLDTGRGEISFFIEAPRPVGWEDSSDLSRVWRLYTTLRPDILVYGGRVLNIVDLTSNPPITRPNVIIECKELEDWYLRIRDLKGPFTAQLTAEEWRNRWIQGLWTGLADILGVGDKEIREVAEGERKTLRVKEPRLLLLYKEVFSPDELILVSRKPIPHEVRKQLEDAGIVVVDGVGFDEEMLAEVAEIIEKYSSRPMSYDALRALGLAGLPLEDAVRILAGFALERIEDFKKYLEKTGR